MAEVGLEAKYVDGKLVQSGSMDRTTKTEPGKPAEKGSSSLDKEAFLQLLVAQMKYQDPLEPTSNTEYISQYATFSELEQMQNMSSGMTLSRAGETVGKQVIIESTKDGKTTTVQGYVEKVVYNGNKAYLSIGGALYSIDDLKQIIDDQYQDGTDKVEAIKTILKKLPKPENVTIAEAGDIINAYNIYDSLNDYQKKLLSTEDEELLDKYVERINTIVNEALDEAEADNTSESEESKIDKLLEERDE